MRFVGVIGWLRDGSQEDLEKNTDSDHFYKQFKENGHSTAATKLLQSLDRAGREKWIHTMEDLKFHPFK